MLSCVQDETLPIIQQQNHIEDSSRTCCYKNHILNPFFLYKALELKALSGQILIVLDILVYTQEECEKDKIYYCKKYLQQKRRGHFQILYGNQMQH